MRSQSKIKTLPNSLSKSNKKLQSPSLTRLNTILSDKLSKGYRYDKNLFHKTIFHLRPLADNPELFTREQSLTTQLLKQLTHDRATTTKSVIPHPVNVKKGL